MAKTNQDKNTRKHIGKGRGSDSNGSAIQNIRTLWNEMNSEPSDFAEYNEFAEQCKAKARREIYGE